MSAVACRDHADVSAAEVCRECGEPWCLECLVTTDELVVPICRSCADTVSPAERVTGAAEETMRFSPRVIDGWAIVHERSR